MPVKALIALLLVACSACSTPSTDAEDAVDTSAQDVPPEEPCSDGKIVLFVRGAVQDGTSGNPLPDARPQACVRVADSSNTLICVRPSTTDETGAFTQSIPFDAQCMAGITFRVSLPQTHRASVYCKAELPESSPALNVEAPFVLYPTEPATELPDLGDPQASRTVRFASGLELDLVPGDLYFPSGTYDDLAATPVDPTGPGLCFLDPAAPVNGLMAFSPEVDVTGAPLPVRIPNTTNLAVGTEVELFVLGGLDCTLASGEPLPEGVWQSIGRGQVSADGSLIEAPDTGVPCLTWLGYREVTP